mmetsp:Transcript_6326/g.9743  ORF Transcript_6326/g.9743 Transcript_6326/m.9743 type:complete len:404 (+) Transcript_6326:145-1356(+)|eukprot:CAMPEP_0178905408 /NCGR_PEP_ID=MMETSP0786-20121207/6261_1 /TAXON_ID=186022 /ORGANISM="Thalassionema frauenfeldii, Strain CCMP 1798" /LENGTH=403 /DNA_ID=CAMNT_0020577017 /DNA_START=104 /DNA_END=1315 /DNA_ORIENTATION=-
MVFYKKTLKTKSNKEADTLEVTGNDMNKLSEELLKVNRGDYSNYAAKTLSTFAGWSYSDFDTFKDKVADNVGSGSQTIMIQVKNEPLLIQATAQLTRTHDKKVAIVTFRGTEMTNLANWMTDAEAKKSDFIDPKNQANDRVNNIQVHTGFKDNFKAVWLGKKGILMHLMYPEMMREDYNYHDDNISQQGKSSELDDLDAIYICGHSLGGAMASLAGLHLALANQNPPAHPEIFSKLFSKLRGVYTYGGPMVADDHDIVRCEQLCGNLTFRHVYYNDIVPHLPPLSFGSFDHFGAEYRYHPRDGWKKRTEGFFGFKSDRSKQVVFIITTGLVGALDGVLDNINWLNFWRGDDYEIPLIGFLSRGWLKMPWSFSDHSPRGYMTTLKKLPDAEERAVVCVGVESRG